MNQYTGANGVLRTGEKFGYYLPWNLSGAALATIGYGLMSLLKPETPAAKWIGYQILYGIGSGCMVSVVSIVLSSLRLCLSSQHHWLFSSILIIYNVSIFR